MSDQWRTLSGTGHRPLSRTNPDGLTEPQLVWVRERCRAALPWLVAEHGVTEVWSGFAAGLDLVLAAASFNAGVPFVAHIPYLSQPIGWPREWSGEWIRLRSIATREVIYGPNPTSKWQAVQLLDKRNDGLLEADALLGCWSGRRKGGTWNAIEKAQDLGLPGVLLDPVARTTRVVEPGAWF